MNIYDFLTGAGVWQVLAALLLILVLGSPKLVQWWVKSKVSHDKIEIAEVESIESIINRVLEHGREDQRDSSQLVTRMIEYWRQAQEQQRVMYEEQIQTLAARITNLERQLNESGEERRKSDQQFQAQIANLEKDIRKAHEERDWYKNQAEEEAIKVSLLTERIVNLENGAQRATDRIALLTAAVRKYAGTDKLPPLPPGGGYFGG